MTKDIRTTKEGDLFFNELGQLEFIKGNDLVRQKVQVRLRWFYGEWFLNKLIGVPYLQKILIKNPNELDITEYIKREILLVDEIASISSFKVDFYINERKLDVQFTALIDGEQVEFDESIVTI